MQVQPITCSGGLIALAGRGDTPSCRDLSRKSFTVLSAVVIRFAEGVVRIMDARGITYGMRLGGAAADLHTGIRVGAQNPRTSRRG